MIQYLRKRLTVVYLFASVTLTFISKTCAAEVLQDSPQALSGLIRIMDSNEGQQGSTRVKLVRAYLAQFSKEEQKELIEELQKLSSFGIQVPTGVSVPIQQATNLVL